MRNLFILILLAAWPAQSLELNAAISGNLEAGQLGNSSLGLSQRWMTAVTPEGTIGLNFSKKWSLGIDAQFRLQQQQTSLDAAGNTNLAGFGQLYGIYASVDLDKSFTAQIATDLFGRYDLSQHDSAGQQVHLDNPRTVQVKLNWFPKECEPWSFDALASYQSWRDFSAGGTSESQASDQWMVGVGISYNFRREKTEGCAVSKASTERPSKVEAQTQADVAPESHRTVASPANLEVAPEQSLGDLPTKVVPGGVTIVLPSATFYPGSAFVGKAYHADIVNLGRALSRRPDISILVTGYTDNQGAPERNVVVSTMRAEAVRDILIQNGVTEAQVRAVGKGSEDPVGDNKTEEGRALNRRVEIFIGDVKK